LPTIFGDTRAEDVVATTRLLGDSNNQPESYGLAGIKEEQRSGFPASGLPKIPESMQHQLIGDRLAIAEKRG